MDQSPRQMIPDLLAAANLWSPDVFVVSNYDLSGLIAAELLDLPYATCNISFRWPRELIKLMCGPTLAQLRAEFNLPPDPDCLAYGRYLDLCLTPDGWTLGRTMAQPAYAQVVARKLLGSQRRMALQAALPMCMLGLDDARQRRIRQRRPNPRELYVRPAGGAPASAPPGWLADLPDQPTVYVSLGTVFNAQYPEVFGSILAGLRNEPVNLIMTLGANGDPARFGPQPPNVHIERYIPQSEIVPYVDVCLNHGGYNTVIEPLLHGIPQVVLPLAADQPVLASYRFWCSTPPLIRWLALAPASSHRSHKRFPRRNSLSPGGWSSS
jgi:UDP:flavonoid glycosyltransferase YjiC (YdhE family)